VYAVARYRKELAALSGSEAIEFLSTRFPGRGYKKRMFDVLESNYRVYSI